MRRIALMLFLAVTAITAITLTIGLADAGTYTVKWVNVTSINDTLNLNFVSTVSNATLTLNSTAKIDVFPLAAATTEPAQYCIKISGNWINITNSTGYLKASFYDSNFWKYVNSTGADIRITNQSSQLYFWIQDFNATAKTATIWVNLTTGSTELDIYYGNPSASPSAYINGSKVFMFFDDFTGTALDSKWKVSGTPTITISSSIIKVVGALGALDDAVYSTVNFTPPFVMWYKVAHTNLSLIGWEDPNDLAADSGTIDWYTSQTINEWRLGVGTGTAWNYATLGTIDTSWHIDTMKITSYGASLWRDGVLKTTIAQTQNITYGVIDFRAWGGTVLCDWIFVASLADPATFSTPYQTQQNITVTVGTFTITTNASTIAIPLTAFSSTTHVIITPVVESARFNATLTFNYAYSSTSTIIDTGIYYEKKFSLNTSGLTTPITLNVTFPIRTAKYAEFVNVTPSTTVTNSTVNGTLVTSYILQNNTTYTIDERIGYLIASFTGKDELTGSTLSSITVNYTSSSGWKSVSGPTVSIYGTDLPLHQTETVIEFSSTSYSSRHYILDCTKLNQSITLYLLADSSATMITYTVVSGTSTLPNAKVEIYKYIGDNYVLIDSQYTDASGVVAVPLHAFDTYRVVASKQGYDTITATITVTQSTYTIKLGGVSIAIPASHRVVIMFKPSQSTLQPGNNIISVEVIPQGTTVITATMTVYVNNTQVATVTKSDITTPTTLSATVNLNQSSSVSVEVSYIENGQTITTRKNYTVPLATGMWAALLLMNQQLIRTPNGKSIGMLIAAFIALAVVAGLAATTNTTARGLGLVGLIVFTIIALPLNAIPLNILIVVWVAVLASWVVWRWI